MTKQRNKIDGSPLTGYDDDDQGKAVGIAQAMPGWWVVPHGEHKPEERDPIAAWVLIQTAIVTSKGELKRYLDVEPLCPTGRGWSGEVVYDRKEPTQVVYKPEWTEASYYLQIRMQRALEAVKAARELAADSDPIQPLLARAFDALSFSEAEGLLGTRRPDAD